MPLVAAILVMLAGLGLQMVMVVGVIAPNMALALGGYAALFVGMFMVLPAAIRRARRHRDDPRDSSQK